jgi:hypothetical protein
MSREDKSHFDRMRLVPPLLCIVASMAVVIKGLVDVSAGRDATFIWIGLVLLFAGGIAVLIARWMSNRGA